MHEPRLLAIVPARGASKRLPRKNIRPLAGRPLIAWSIASGLASGVCCDVLVSTDDAPIADVARQAGALVPWLRPAELATDTATTSDVLRHALAWYEDARGVVDGVLLLQPTSPLRRVESIRGAVQAFLDQPGSDRRTVVSVSPVEVPPHWCFTLVGDELRPVVDWTHVGIRSQDLPTSYRLNGSIYVATAQAVRRARPLVAPGTLGFVMRAPAEAVDIDTEDDWRVAESLASNMGGLLCD